MYQQNLLKRPPAEFLWKVYKAQTVNPDSRDSIKMIHNDFETLQIEMNENEMQIKSKCE